MKTTAKSILVILLLLTLPGLHTVTHAQETTPKGTAPTLKTTRAPKETNRETLKERTGELAEIRKERLRGIISKIYYNYEKRINNYREFLERVISRKDKLEAQGKDVSRLNTFIETARTNITKAETALADVQTAINAIDYTKPTKDIKTNVMSLLKRLREALTLVHTSMSQAVEFIKAQSETPTNGETRVRPSVSPSPVPTRTQ